MKGFFKKIFNRSVEEKTEKTENKSSKPISKNEIEKKIYNLSDIKDIYDNHKLLNDKSLWEQEPFKSCMAQSKHYMSKQFKPIMIATSLSENTDCIIYMDVHNLDVMLIVDKRPVIIFKCIVDYYSYRIEEVDPYLKNGQTWISQISKAQSLQCWWSTGDNRCICLYNKPWVWDDNDRIDVDIDLSGVINLANKTLMSILKKLSVVKKISSAQNSYNDGLIKQQKQQKIKDYHKMLSTVIDNVDNIKFDDSSLPDEITFVKTSSGYVLKNDKT